MYGYVLQPILHDFILEIRRKRNINHLIFYCPITFALSRQPPIFNTNTIVPAFGFGLPLTRFHLWLIFHPGKTLLLNRCTKEQFIFQSASSSYFHWNNDNLQVSFPLTKEKKNDVASLRTFAIAGTCTVMSRQYSV